MGKNLITMYRLSTGRFTIWLHLAVAVVWYISAIPTLNAEHRQNTPELFKVELSRSFLDDAIKMNDYSESNVAVSKIGDRAFSKVSSYHVYRP
jgi:hypothetical protein